MRAAAITSFLVGFLILLDRYMQAWPTLLQQQPGPRPAHRHHRRQHAEHRRRLLGPEPGLLHPPDPAHLGADPHFTGRLHTVHPGLDAGNHEHGLHPDRPGQGAVRADRRHAPRLPQRPDPDSHDRGLRHRGTDRRCRHHGTVFSVRGMGFLFLDGIEHVDPNPVMGVFVCVAITAMVIQPHRGPCLLRT